MSQNMPPSVSTITTGQSAKFADLIIAALRKSGLPSEPTQKVLEDQGAALAHEVVALVRQRVEAISDLIVRHVSVNRSRSRQEAIRATNMAEYLDDGVVATMPQGEGDTAAVHFFKLDRYISDDDVEKEYALRGLKPADPYALAAVNEADPAFADEHPNCTHWKDAHGNWCYAAFDRWCDERSVDVYRSGDRWIDHWWFAGVGK